MSFSGIMPTNEDEFYTPKILVRAILKYIPRDAIVWCPFDRETSEFVTVLRQRGLKVVHSHISEGKDFFEYEPEKWDVIVSNPPYSLKKKVLERLYSFEKPFAVVLGLPILNYQEIGYFFYQRKGLQLLIVDKKVSFNGDTSSFNSSYFCRNFLPNDLMFEHLPHNNTGRFYSPSGMEVDRKEIKNRLGLE